MNGNTIASDETLAFGELNSFIRSISQVLIYSALGKGDNFNFGEEMGVVISRRFSAPSSPSFAASSGIEPFLMRRFDVVIPVEIVSGVGRAEPIGCQGCTYNSSIIAIDALIVGVAVKGIPSDEAVGGDVVRELGEEGRADKEAAEEQREGAHGKWFGGINVTNCLCNSLTLFIYGSRGDNAVPIPRWGWRGSGGGS